MSGWIWWSGQISLNFDGLIFVVSPQISLPWITLSILCFQNLVEAFLFNFLDWVINFSLFRHQVQRFWIWVGYQLGHLRLWIIEIHFRNNLWQSVIEISVLILVTRWIDAQLSGRRDILLKGATSPSHFLLANGLIDGVHYILPIFFLILVCFQSFLLFFITGNRLKALVCFVKVCIHFTLNLHLPVGIDSTVDIGYQLDCLVVIEFRMFLSVLVSIRFTVATCSL